MTNREKYQGKTVRELADIYVSTYGATAGMTLWLDEEYDEPKMKKPKMREGLITDVWMPRAAVIYLMVMASKLNQEGSVLDLFMTFFFGLFVCDMIITGIRNQKMIKNLPRNKN